MEDLKINDKITFNDEDWHTIEDVADTITSLKIGLESISESLLKKQELLWEIIHTIKPELKDYRCILEKKEKQVRVLRKNLEDE